MKIRGLYKSQVLSDVLIEALDNIIGTGRTLLYLKLTEHRRGYEIVSQVFSIEDYVEPAASKGLYKICKFDQISSTDSLNSILANKYQKGHLNSLYLLIISRIEELVQ